MKVFIVGGTGYLGSVVVRRLVASGHTVAALSRSDASDTTLTALGAAPVHGSLADVAVLRRESSDADATIWAASDYAATEESMQAELEAVNAIVTGAGDGASTRAKPVIYTSTGLVYGQSPTSTDEDAALPEISAQPVKAAAERIVLEARGVIGMRFRAGLIFGRGGTLLLTGLIAAARANGAATYIEEGANTWRPVHVDDLADLYVRALEHPVAGAYNVVGDHPFSFRELAEAIGELTGTPAVSIPLSVAEQSMGGAAITLTSTSSIDSAKARATFGWMPTAGPLPEDIRHGSYARDEQHRF